MYIHYLLMEPSALRRDLLDRTAGPFAARIVITPMLLCADGVYPFALSISVRSSSTSNHDNGDGRR